MDESSNVLQLRYGDVVALNDTGKPESPKQLLASMLGRGSCRSFLDKTVSEDLIKLLCAAALASPTKSDLQQRDIILVQDGDIRADLNKVMGTQDWVAAPPYLAVFCGNNSRQRLLHKMRGHAFANDHLDAFFNATVDAAIALGAFVIAAERVGLGCCPISAIRNDCETVSKLLKLPDHVFPVAGLAFGYPKAESPKVAMRLPLSTTIHKDRFETDNVEALISDYDQRRTEHQPYNKQRAVGQFGLSTNYCWSEDKSRQYALPEREGFGAYIKNIGFKLD